MNISNFRFQIFSFILLFFLVFRFCLLYSNQPQLKNGQKLSFETTVLSQPQVAGSRQIFIANYKHQSANRRINIITSRFPEISYGDVVRISGLISNKDYGALMYFPQIETIDNPAGVLQSSLKNINTLRQKLITLFAKTLPLPSSSLLLGIIFGIKEQMPKDFTNNLRTSGVFHVIAASGMNVTLVGGFVSTLFTFFLKRQIAIGLSILVIMFYAILAGLEPSIIRASIMGVLVFSAQIMGRQALAVNSLFSAGFIMLFVDPTLLSDIGFQLSFAATFGILYVKPLLEQYKKVNSIRYLIEKSRIGPEILTTVAAQIATIPILLANFGTYSVYSILVNGLVLWTVPILMIAGGLGAIFGLILAPLGQLLIYFCYPLLLYFETIVNFSGKAGGVLIIKNLSWQFIVGYYCLLVSALLIFKKNK